MTKTNGTILIIDDNPINLEVLYETLITANYEIFVQMSGEEGIEIAIQQQPDLILLDIMMPDMDGFETCRRLQANAITQSIPIIFMTALCDSEDKIKGLSLGAVDYITKPFRQKEVLARVNIHIKLKRATHELEQRVEERTQELSQTLHSLKQMQLQLVQNEKMSALGQLVAGVAHEINNPMGCINGNFVLMEDSVKGLFQIIDCYQKELPQPSVCLQECIEAVDLDYLRSDLPKMFESMHTAISRIKDISNSLRTFSRADNNKYVLFNIHEAINSTVLILKHRLKASDTRTEIEVYKDYGELPLIECYPGQLNQVFMNIIANAIDAIDEANLQQKNYIAIKTTITENQKSVLISIKDSGLGISQKIKNQIFEHLFTTKEVGKGTGLGLAIVHQIIIKKHHGSIEVNSEIGKGTEFLITIPIYQ